MFIYKHSPQVTQREARDKALQPTNCILNVTSFTATLSSRYTDTGLERQWRRMWVA